MFIKKFIYSVIIVIEMDKTQIKTKQVAQIKKIYPESKFDVELVYYKQKYTGITRFYYLY